MRERSHATAPEQRDRGVSLDPICGSPVVEQDAPSMEYRERKYFFCSERCRARFAKQAERMRMSELARMGGLFAARKVRWGIA